MPCLGLEDETKLFLADKQVIEVDINNQPIEKQHQ
jgi:hypothetical protein